MERFQAHADLVKPLLTAMVQSLLVADRVTVVSTGPWVYRLKFKVGTVGQADCVSLAFPMGSGFETLLWDSKTDKAVYDDDYTDSRCFGDSVEDALAEVLRLCDLAKSSYMDTLRREIDLFQ